MRLEKFLSEFASDVRSLEGMGWGDGALRVNAAGRSRRLRGTEVHHGVLPTCRMCVGLVGTSHSPIQPCRLCPVRSSSPRESARRIAWSQPVSGSLTVETFVLLSPV
jgi:hypothetical protein